MEKSIFFRGKDCEKNSHLFVIPNTCLLSQYSCFIHNNNNTNKMLEEEEEFDFMFNHSCLHTNPVHFSLPRVSAPDQPPGLFEARWAALSSTIYFFGPRSNNRNTIYCLDRKVDLNVYTSHLSFKKAGYTIIPRDNSSVLALDDKLYIFGGDDNNVYIEVFEPCDRHCPKGQSRDLSSPPSAIRPEYILFSVAMEKEKKIILCWGEGNILEYCVAADSWVHHKINFEIKFRSANCKTVVAGSCFYWLDKNMQAYDINTRLSYERPIQDFMIQHVLETSDDCDFSNEFQASLLHLTGDLFYFIWVDRRLDETLHCTMIQMLRTTTNIRENHYKLEVNVLSCQTFFF